MGHKGGKTIKFAYKVRGVEYQSDSSGALGRGAIGKQCFISVIPKYPKDPVLLEVPVPPCFISIDPPVDGWKEIPTCLK